MKGASEGKNAASTSETGKNCNTGKSVRVRPQNPFKLIDCEKFSPVPCYSWYNVPSSAPCVPTPGNITTTAITSTCVTQLPNNNSSASSAPTTVSVPSPGSSDSGCSSASSNLTSASSCGQVATEAPFTVMISVEVLTIIDIHAHCVSNEVIGLLGGRYCPVFKQLHVLIAEPCKSISASTTDLQCEMDPVSQTEAAGKIFSSNNFVIGWYHSHPTFVPNPSLRDLETQGNYQEMFRQESNLPFIAIILSPYSGPCNPRHKHTLVSKFKCLMLSDQINPQVSSLFLQNQRNNRYSIIYTLIFQITSSSSYILLHLLSCVSRFPSLLISLPAHFFTGILGRMKMPDRHPSAS